MFSVGLALALGLTWHAGAASPAIEPFAIRGHQQALHLYGKRGGPVVIVASGDGGWVHLGPYVAEFLSNEGYFVLGFDSKAYLSSFTSGDKTLGLAEVPADFATLVDHATQLGGTAPLLCGVSEGAALAVLAAANETVKAKVTGVIALGLPDEAELGWRFRDSLIYLTKGVPKEPMFSTADVVGKLSPLPLVAIHSTRDEFVNADEVKRVMSRALEPRQLWFIDAANHRFGGKEQDLNRKLLEALAWIKAQHR